MHRPSDLSPAALLPLLAALLLPAAAACAQPEPGAAEAGEELPPGVEQILPRGGIPAVVEPTFVAAGEADLPDDAWVLGVVLDGQARAFSLNLLNRHEVVNDRIADTAYAAVW